jgi:hypothetical protein
LFELFFAVCNAVKQASATRGFSRTDEVKPDPCGNAQNYILKSSNSNHQNIGMLSAQKDV